MKILVTGGAGFIGSHIVDALIRIRQEVIVIDDLSTGRKENLNPKAIFRKIDVTDFPRVENVFKKEKPDVVFHLAAQIDVRKSVADPLADARSNILASINLIELSRKYGVKKFIFSSTGGAIYGDTEERPTKEEHSEWPLSPYGIAKLTVDKYLNFAYELSELNFVSLRYGNVYGPRQNPHGEAGVVAIFLGKMLRGEQPVINGDGLQTRDYVFVGDVVRANLVAFRKKSLVGIFNVGTGRETSVVDLFREINRNFQGKFAEKHGPAKEGEQRTSCLNSAKMKKATGWKAEVGVREGLRKTYLWFNENFDR